MQTALTLDAALCCRGSRYVCRVTAGGGAFCATLREPASLAGLTARWDGQDLTLSYLGLTYRPTLPDTLFADTLQLLRGALSSAPQAQREGDRLTGRTGGFAYTLELTADGLPTKLEIPGADLTAEFSDVQPA